MTIEDRIFRERDVPSPFSVFENLLDSIDLSRHISPRLLYTAECLSGVKANAGHFSRTLTDVA